MKNFEKKLSIAVLDKTLHYSSRTLHGLRRLQAVFTEETNESIIMLEIYSKFLSDKASPEELAQANKQFQDLVKTLGLGTLFILPGGMVTLPLAILAARKLGIDIVPDAFKRRQSTQKTMQHQKDPPDENQT